MKIKLTLSSKEILNQVFKKGSPGYDANQVDSFLDIVLKDYVTVEANALMLQKDIDDLNKQIIDLKEEKYQLELELGKFKNRFDGIKDSDVVEKSNMEYVKRINKLENYLFRIGVDPKSIK